MSFQDILSYIVNLNIPSVFIVAAGGIGGWLGKIWVSKKVEKYRSTSETELAKLKSDLERSGQQEIEGLRYELNALQQKEFKGFQDKLAIYRMVVDLLSDFLSDLSYCHHLNEEIPSPKIKDFDRLRMKSYGYISMLAPQSVIDAHEDLVEIVFDILEKKQEFDWVKIRVRCLALLNAVRIDLGLNSEPVVYNGNR